MARGKREAIHCGRIAVLQLVYTTAAECRCRSRAGRLRLQRARSVELDVWWAGVRSGAAFSHTQVITWGFWLPAQTP